MKRILIGVLALLVSHAALADYIGDFKLGSTVTFEFNTYKATDGSDLQRTVAGTVSCIPNGSTTEITAGTADTGTTAFDTSTGANKITITATTGNGYAAATDYDCGFRAATLNAVTVSAVNIFSFSIENRAPLKGYILARGTLAAGSTTSVANLGAALTFSNQYVARVIENTDTGEQQCITASTDSGSNDTATFAPNVPTAWSTSANWAIYNTIPCYPVTLPAVSGAGGVYLAGIISSGTADFDATSGANLVNYWKNGGASAGGYKIGDTQTSLSTISTGITALPGNVWGYVVEPNASVTAKCAMAMALAHAAGRYTSTASTPPFTTTFKDPSGTTVRIVGTVTTVSLDGVTITCP